MKVIEENNTIPSNFKGKAIVDINSGLIKKMNCKTSQKETFSQEGSKFFVEMYMKLNWTAEEIK
ncbi:MAG: hypothetical protein KF781_00660 [Chitinophagaceae bacterium]|nr:hypothetical protein [Chitinophagaceae bacterium]MCW5905245.1 hypothetical protein [Chitinophagaceae bacterium]